MAMAMAMVTVADPGRYWRTATLADLGCATTGAESSWVRGAGPGQGTTAEAAVSEVVHDLYRLGDRRLSPAGVGMSRAPVGYTAAALQTWIVTSAGQPYLTATASTDGSVHTANPDLICHTP